MDRLDIFVTWLFSQDDHDLATLLAAKQFLLSLTARLSFETTLLP